MRITTSLLAGIVLAMVLAGCGHETAHRSAPASPQGADVSVLFTQSATSGTLEPAGKDRRVLTLRGVGRQTVWFQDRPGRKAGQQSTSTFVRNWAKSGFVDDAPNAALTLLDGRDEADTLVVELVSRPDYDPAHQTIRYTVRVLDEAPEGLRAFDADHTIPGTFSQASLFVDSSVGVPPTAFYGGTFAGGTPVLMSDGGLAHIEDISVGDEVMSIGTDGAPTPAPVTFSGGTGAAGRQPTMIYLRFDVDGHSRTLIMTRDVTFANGTQAEHLVPSDTVRGVDGSATVESVAVGAYEGGVHGLGVGGPTGMFIAGGVPVHGWGEGPGR